MAVHAWVEPACSQAAAAAAAAQQLAANGDGGSFPQSRGARHLALMVAAAGKAQGLSTWALELVPASTGPVFGGPKRGSAISVSRSTSRAVR